MPRIAVYSLLVCVLALVAAVVSFAQGSWLGIVWVLMFGVSSNMTWFYYRKGQIDKQRAAAAQRAQQAGGCAAQQQS